MSGLLTALGFPPVEKRDAVRFMYARNLPYNQRIMWAGGLALIGLALQIAFLLPWFGLPFVLLAVGLVMVEGFDSRPKLKHFDIDPNWVNVEIAQVHEMESLRRKTAQWDSDGFFFRTWYPS